MRALVALLIIAVLLTSCAPVEREYGGASLLAEDGILEWLNVPAAIHEDGTTYYAYQSFGGGAKGLDAVWVNSFDHGTRDTGKPFRLRAYTEADDSRAEPDEHGSPALALNQDGRLVCVYAKHTSRLYSRVSSQPFGHTSFEEEQVIETGSSSYPQLHRMSDDTLVLLYRYYEGGQGENSTSSIRIRQSIDGGLTWSQPTQVIMQQGMAAYIQSCAIGDRIDVVLTPHIYAEARRYRNIYHVYSSDGGKTWRRSDGSPLTLPIDEASATLVYEDTSDGWWSWAFDIAAQSDGDPRVVFYSNLGGNTLSGQGDSTRRPVLHYARLLGSQWSVTEVGDAPSFWSGEGTYPAGAAIDPNNVSRLVVCQGANGTSQDQSRNNARNNTDSTAVATWYTTRDDGEQWVVGEPLYETDGFNIRPQFTRGMPAEQAFVVVSNVRSYVSYYEWDSSLVGIDASDIELGVSE